MNKMQAFAITDNQIRLNDSTQVLPMVMMNNEDILNESNSNPLLNNTSIRPQEFIKKNVYFKIKTIHIFETYINCIYCIL